MAPISRALAELGETYHCTNIGMCVQQALIPCGGRHQVRPRPEDVLTLHSNLIAPSGANVFRIPYRRVPLADSTAAPISGQRKNQLSNVRGLSIAQVTPLPGSDQTRQPLEPAWPNDSGAASAGAQCGDLSPRSSTPRPHGQRGHLRMTIVPPRPPVWSLVASLRSSGDKNPAGTPSNARTRAIAPAAVAISPPQGRASERQKGVLYGSRSVPAWSANSPPATRAGVRGGSTPRYASMPSGAITRSARASTKRRPVARSTVTASSPYPRLL